MSIELKIKSKHLTEESKIIRHEERKLLAHSRHQLQKMRDDGHNGDLNLEAYQFQGKYRSLNHHRRWNVRNEARATYLTRAYLKGKPYSFVEQKRKEENEFTFRQYIVPRIVSMVAKYGEKHYPKEVWKGSFPDRKKVSNPELKQLKEDILEWANL